MLLLPEESECGIDECGLGCLMGDAVAGAVLFSCPLPEFPWLGEIRDSKKLSAKKRARLAGLIREHALAWGIGVATAKEVDDHNILNARFMAMQRALDAAYAMKAFDKILVDGDKFKPYIPPAGGEWLSFRCEPEGDNRFLHIAAASIIAKDYRDKKVLELVDAHPELKLYGIHKNMGYGTPEHLRALREHGPTTFHRMTFKPVAALQHDQHDPPEDAL